MTKELIQKLIVRAKDATDNAYCPITEVAIGACLLVDGNQTVTGCNIESFRMGAGQVALAKAISDGITGFRAIAFWSEKVMPFPSGAELDCIAEFAPSIDIIVASKDNFSMHKIHELLPIRSIYD